MGRFFFVFLLISAIFLEGTVTTLPLTLLFLLCWVIVRRSMSTFPLAFFSGLALDLFALRALGSTSIFFLVFIFLIFLYQRKYEIYSYPFVFAASFLGSAGFLGIFGYEDIFLKSVMSSLLALVLFWIMKRIGRK